MTTISQLDAGMVWTGVSRSIGLYDGIPPDWIVKDPPSEPTPGKFYRVASDGWLELDEHPGVPTALRAPDRRSKIEFRRLLKPKEALWFDAAEAEPPMTQEELDEAFDPNTMTPALQLLAAKRDAIMQWRLLADVVELDHDDTRDFLYVMGACGMFGADMTTRIARILSGEPPE